MIWLGPAGIPTVCKGSSSIDGIKTVSELELNAMEIEFVRGVKMGNEMAKEVGAVAKKLNIRLSVHAPYFINLSSAEKVKIEQSKRRILESVEKAHLMHADTVVIHPGYYGKFDPEETYEMTRDACRDMIKSMISKNIKDVKMGLETAGKHSQFGTLDEIIKIHKELKTCVPVVDFAHMLARQDGRMDYGEVLGKLKKLKLKHYHTHFSNIEFTERGERRHLVLDKKPPFEPLAKEILKRKLNITIISESPILEQDSLKMKRIFEKLGYTF
ncbi:MAG: TIM barrel protein [Candidatus Bathyarchaeota archaeon]|nr:TIM barrel protein [Candidatus Bathyarchaeota archaeon]